MSPLEEKLDKGDRVVVMREREGPRLALPRIIDISFRALILQREGRFLAYDALSRNDLCSHLASSCLFVFY